MSIITIRAKLFFIPQYLVSMQQQREGSNLSECPATLDLHLSLFLQVLISRPFAGWLVVDRPPPTISQRIQYCSRSLHTAITEIRGEEIAKLGPVTVALASDRRPVIFRLHW